MPPDTIAVLAEKPSVARDIARVLGASQRGDGYLHGNGYVVTWAIGHLVALAQPHEINPDWKRWRRDHLPMLPRDWPLVVSEETKAQFEVVRRVITAPEIERVVCATDAGREGELIFRYIYEAAGCRKPFQRLWISSLTPDAIRQGFRKLRAGRDLDPLADAARGRSRADWLVGMNLSRAYSLAFNEEQLSVGRVQTPTLAMLVERELAIRAFVPEDYLEVVATFSPGRELAADLSYKGTWFRGRRAESGGQADQDAAGRQGRRGSRGGDADRPARPHRQGRGRVDPRRDQADAAAAPLRPHRAAAARQPPLRLQRQEDAGRRAGALRAAEAHQLSAHRQPPPLDRRRRHPRRRSCGRSRAPTRDKLAPGTGERPLGRRFVDDSKVTDHHAIIPTTTSPDVAALGEDERKIYDLICRRLLSAWHDDHVWSVTTVITAISNPPPSGVGEPLLDRFHSTGTLVEQVGWKVLDIDRKAKKERPKDGEGGRTRRRRPSPPPRGEPGPAARPRPGAAAGGAGRHAPSPSRPGRPSASPRPPC